MKAGADRFGFAVTTNTIARDDLTELRCQGLVSALARSNTLTNNRRGAPDGEREAERC